MRDKLGRFKGDSPTKIKCKVCDKSFYVFPYRKDTAKYCSRKCYEKDEKGVQKHSEKSKRKISEAQTGEKSGRWKGGRVKDRDGYILVKKHGHPFSRQMNYVLEHRLIVEAYIGRYLKPEEVVHHINKIVDDNRLENLILFKSGSKHIKHHRSLDRLNRNNISR